MRISPMLQTLHSPHALEQHVAQKAMAPADTISTRSLYDPSKCVKFDPNRSDRPANTQLYRSLPASSTTGWIFLGLKPIQAGELLQNMCYKCAKSGNWHMSCAADSTLLMLADLRLRWLRDTRIFRKLCLKVLHLRWTSLKSSFLWIFGIFGRWSAGIGWDLLQFWHLSVSQFGLMRPDWHSDIAREAKVEAKSHRSRCRGVVMPWTKRNQKGKKHV